jgi:transposase
MRRALPDVFETVEELQALMTGTSDLQRKQRVHLLLLIRSERVHSRHTAAAHLAVHRNSVGDWLAKYEKGGLEAMLDIGTPGAKPGIRALSPAALTALKARLEGEGFDSYKQIQEWIGREFDRDVPYPTVHRIVRHRLQSKLKRARPRNVKKTPSKQQNSPGA